MTLTAALCDLALDLRWTELSAGARCAASRATGNALALMVGAARHPAVVAAVRAVSELGAGDPVAVLGRAERLPAVWAALVHGIAVHAEDYDDTHPPTVIHPGAPVVPAALSAAVLADASGAELLAAVTAGMETALRVGVALMPAALDRGWHMTGIAGPVGAAIAAGRLLGLDHHRLHSAVGLAATQAAGVLEALGTMAKPLHAGKAATNGLEAALLAQHGLEGPAAPIEGRRGLVALYGGRTDPDGALDGLGSRWEIETNEIKPYACGVVSHSIIDIAVALAAERAGEPASVRLDVHPFVLVAMGRTAPRTGLEAKFSATQCFAVGYLDGAAGPEQFADEVVRRPDVVALRDRCRLVADPALPRYGVRAEITTTDGQVVRRERGHPEPLGPDGVRRKALALAGPVLGADAEGFVDAAFAFDAVASVREFSVAAQASQVPR
jgi:2-methylcitrate dehydratase PrpD